MIPTSCASGCEVTAMIAMTREDGRVGFLATDTAQINVVTGIMIAHRAKATTVPHHRLAYAYSGSCTDAAWADQMLRTHDFDAIEATGARALRDEYPRFSADVARRAAERGEEMLPDE